MTNSAMLFRAAQALVAAPVATSIASPVELETGAIDTIELKRRLSRFIPSFDLENGADGSCLTRVREVNDLSDFQPVQTERAEQVVRRAPKPKLQFRSLEAWEGTVTKIEGGAFTATLKSESNAHIEEVADFDLQDVSPDDLSLVQLGAMFYWDIGYLSTAGGRRRSSEIRFRRLRPWEAADIEAAASEASTVSAELNWK